MGLEVVGFLLLGYGAPVFLDILDLLTSKQSIDILGNRTALERMFDCQSTQCPPSFQQWAISLAFYQSSCSNMPE